MESITGFVKHKFLGHVNRQTRGHICVKCGRYSGGKRLCTRCFNGGWYPGSSVKVSGEWKKRHYKY